MLIDYNGNRPLNLTLQSGLSLYLKPKQKDVEISEQDYYQTGKLVRLRGLNPHLFSNIRLDDELEQAKKKSKPSNRKKSKKQDYDFSDPKFKPKHDPTTQSKSVAATLAFGEEKPMLKGEKKRKVTKKHTKRTKLTITKGNPTKNK